jgi:hypothetical protein
MNGSFSVMATENDAARKMWKAINRAIRTAQFIPVLGPEVPCWLLDRDHPTQQDRQRGILTSRVQDLVAAAADEFALRVKNGGRLQGETDPLDGDDGWVPKERTLPSRYELYRQTPAYLKGLTVAAYDGRTVIIAPSVSADDGELLTRVEKAQASAIVQFQLALARLAILCTWVWGAGLCRTPEPLGLQPVETPIVLDIRTDPYEKYRWLLAMSVGTCIDIAATLAEDSALWTDHQGLAIESIYPRLMRLAAEFYGDFQEFTSYLGDAGIDEEQFKGRHTRLLEQFPDVTGFCTTDGSQVVCVLPQHEAGVRASNIVWLQSLLRHTLASGTRAYRSRAELAFALSLTREGEVTVPNRLNKLYEITGVDAPDHAVVLKGIVDNLSYCSTADDDSHLPRVPTPFHVGLAKALVLNMERFATTDKSKTRESDKLGGGRTSTEEKLREWDAQGIVINTGLDLELERAFEGLGIDYHVLVPVFIDSGADVWDDPDNGNDSEADDEDDDADDDLDRGWALGTFDARRERETGWCLLPTAVRTEQLIAAGALSVARPLIIKLFGSPLHEVHEAQTLKGTKYEGRVFPRLILSETDVLATLVETIPVFDDWKRDDKGGAKRPKGMSLFFFGQDVSNWSDRVHLYTVEEARQRRLGQEVLLSQHRSSAQVRSGGDRQPCDLLALRDLMLKPASEDRPRGVVGVNAMWAERAEA